jgi:small subunit ribosomal protein S17
MAEEEKDQAQNTEEPAEGEAPAAEEAAAEGQAPESEAAEEGAPAAEEGGAEEVQGEEEAPAEEPAAEAEPEEVLSPKEVRKRARSHASGPSRPPRSPEQRAAERAERRRTTRARRRRYRVARRAKGGEPREGTPKAVREPGSRKVRQGTVVSAAADKTITVEIAVVRRHPAYEKIVRRSSKVRAHDEENQAQQGDVVRVIESRPLSRTKRWRLLEVVERGR